MDTDNNINTGMHKGNHKSFINVKQGSQMDDTKNMMIIQK